MSNLLVTEVFPPLVGGSGRFYWEVYRRLSREDYLIAAGEHPEQNEVDRAHDLRVHRVPLRLEGWGVLTLRDLRGYSRAIRRLRRIIKTGHVRMLHCARCLPEGLMGWWIHKTLGIPYFCYVWGEEVSHASASRELAWLTRLVLRQAAFVVTCSRNTKRLLVAEWQVPTERIHIIHPGVDLQWFVPAERDLAVRAALGWHDRPVILTVSRLQKRKGHDQLILALPAIRKVIGDVMFAIVGDGEERETLQQLVNREGMQAHVQFMGSIGADEPRLIQCYQQCDLFVLPNRQVGPDIEGFGMVLVEAQACGRPVVAGMSGGTADTLKDPETGRLVQCGGPDDLAAVVSELLSDRPRLEEMGRAGRQWVVGSFDWDKQARRADELFRSWPAVRLDRNTDTDHRT